MVTGKDKQLIYEKIREYVKALEKNKVPVWPRIEPHSFARTDFDETDPFVREIIATGERIL